MIRPFAVLAATTSGAAFAIAALAAPALAFEEDANYSMRTTLEYQSWSWASPTGARLDYATPLTVFTVMDHSGAVLGAINTTAANEARRREAEREAIRNDQRIYRYTHEEARAAEGTRFGLSVGVGPIMGQTSTNAPTGGTSVPNFSTASMSAHYAKIHLEGDMFELGPGVLVFDSGVAFWSALALPPGTAYTPTARGNLLYIEAWNWPLGLRYRIKPQFLPGLTIEPSFNFDWLYTVYYGINGNWRFDARNFGVEAGYYLHPQVKLRAGYFVNALAHNAVPWMQTVDVVGMRSANVGATLFF